MNKSQRKTLHYLLYMPLAIFLFTSSAIADDQPTLDELLDIPADNSPSAEQQAPVEDTSTIPIDPKLARDIENTSPSDVFVQAVSEMDDAAHRIGDQRDVGLETQRIQQSVLVKLDKVIDAAKKACQSCNSSGQSDPDKKQSGNASNQPKAGQPKPGGNQPNPGNSPSRGQVQQTADNPATLEENRRQWGQLPPRLRDELSQGQSEQFSGIYRDMTESYYKRVAEESQQ